MTAGHAANGMDARTRRRFLRPADLVIMRLLRRQLSNHEFTLAYARDANVGNDFRPLRALDASSGRRHADSACSLQPVSLGEHIVVAGAPPRNGSRHRCGLRHNHQALDHGLRRR